MKYITNYLVANPGLLILLLCGVALYLSKSIYPVIIHLTAKKNLMDEPCNRSSHVQKTPNLGGVGIFIIFVLCMCVSGSVLGLIELELEQLLAIVSAISILFFLGLKDDLIGISPTKKLFGQFLAASIIVFAANLRIDSLHGLFNVEIVNYGVSVVVSIFLFLFFANAFNLIDGIDGLAGTEGVIASFVFGMFFILFDKLFMGLISFVLMACLIGFLNFNLSEKNKIFMGDSGSLFVGFLLMLQAFCFLKLDLTNASFILPNKLVLLFSVFAFPVLDTVRVFFLRIINGKSPFEADRNHLHHKLLDLGLTHLKSTMIIAISNVTLIALAFLTFSLNSIVQFMIVFPLSILLFYFPFLIKNKAKLSSQAKSLS